MNICILCQISLVSFMLIHLNGCTRYPHQSVDLQGYLKGFLGKSSTTIQQELNLRNLGFQIAHAPQKTQNQLTYTVLRPINIPTPMVNNVLIRGESIPVQSGNLSGNSYDINFNCKIIFELQNNIAESIQYQGKAC